MVRAIMEEMSGLTAEIRLFGAEPTPSFPYTKGGREGGRDTPTIWNVVIDDMLCLLL